MSLPHRIPASASVRYIGRDWDNHRHTPTPLHERIVPQTRQRGEHPLISLALVIGLFVGTYVMLAVLS